MIMVPAAFCRDAIIEAAYNDSDGVTAAFNLNMLRHLNAQFDADFDLDAWQHEMREIRVGTAEIEVELDAGGHGNLLYSSGGARRK